MSSNYPKITYPIGLKWSVFSEVHKVKPEETFDAKSTSLSVSQGSHDNLAWECGPPSEVR